MEPGTSPLELWYKEVINKNVDELTIGDYSRMLRQGVLLQVAIPNTIELLTRNPFDGEMYDGQLLEHLLRVIKEHKGLVEKDKLQDLYELASKQVNDYEWDSKQSREEYVGLLKELSDLIED